MQSVDTRDIDHLIDSWNALLKRFPDGKQKALESIGRDLLLNVRDEIGGSGKVAGWQEPHMGSGGGYVAVRAKAKTYQTTKNGNRYAVGYITNAIEGGHQTGGQRPGPKADGYRYRPRYKKAAVPGRWFYDIVRRQMDGMSQDEMDELMKIIVDGLEGRL